MKNSTFVVVAVACTLALVTGCKPKERYTVLPGTSVAGNGNGGGTSTTDLKTTPLGAANETASVNTTLVSDLPDETGLANREFDRAAFKDQTVYFDFDQSNVKAADASKVEQVSGALKARSSDFGLLIEGHCDERGTEEYNRSLGERRALALRELLMKSGIDGQRIYTRTFGKDQPAATGHDEAAWSQNRRGEFVLVLPKKITTTQNTK